MVTVFGLGFVGLTTALGFADLGYQVYGIDVNAERRKMIQDGTLPFLEPHLDEKLKEHINNNFVVTEDIKTAVAKSEYIFYCVGTPYGKEGSADLSYLFSAIDATVAVIQDDRFRVLVTKSTIPPSTTMEKITPYVRNKGKISNNLGVANNPEFLREGHCWEDFIDADRIVLGCQDQRSEKMLKMLYEPMQIPIYCVSPTTGEFIKYLSNTLLATMISYSNEMAQVADTIGDIDVISAFHILHMDKRWNQCNMTSYVYPGCGYGGYCLPKDTCALFAQAAAKGFEPPILKNVIATNENRPAIMAKKIVQDVETNEMIGILGFSFKPESDDVRDTAAYKIIKELNRMGYHKIIAYDPVAMKEFQKHYPDVDIVYSNSIKDVYTQAKVIAIVTAWTEFKNIKDLGNKKIIDCRYMLKK